MKTGVGIVLGSDAVTVAALQRRGGSLALSFYRHLPLEALGAGQDPSAQRLAQALCARLAREGLRLREVRLGVSGRDAIVRYSHLPPMPDWRLKLLMEMEIADVAERTGEPLSADHYVLRSGPEGSLVLVALAKDARVQEVVDGFAAVGVEVGGAVPQPVATADCHRFLGEASSVGVALVLDVSQDSTEVALVEEGELLFARSVALGASRGSGQVAQVVKASLDYARGQLKRRNLAVEHVWLAGSAARNAGLSEAIGAELSVECTVFDPLADLDRSPCDPESRETADAHGPEAATAVGLAMGAVLPEATPLNLLPRAVKRALEYRHRTVWLQASAVVLGVALLASLGLAYWELRGERQRAEALARANTELGARLAAHEKRRAGNDAREADLRALADRARPGVALNSLLALLGKVTPAEISLSEATLARGEERGAFSFEFSGLADDAQGRAVQAMRSLQAALEADPDVARVELVPQGEEGTAHRFRLRVEPRSDQGPAGGDS